MKPITKRDVVGIQHDLANYYEHGYGKVLRVLRWFSPNTHESDLDRGEALGRSVRAADGVFISGKMTDLAVAVGRSLDYFAMSREDLEDHRGGLLIWGKPIGRIAHHARAGTELTPSIVAVHWRVVDEGLHVELLVDSDELWQDAKTRQVFRASGPPARLFPVWSETLPLDGEEHAWSRITRDPTASEGTLRTLLATLLFARQDSESRRSLHEEELVAAPKSVQKRIAAEGGDPTKRCRYISFRQRKSSKAGRPTSASDRRYKHRWWVVPHRKPYPVKGRPDLPKVKFWVGPWLAEPRGTENAPILGSDRVFVLEE